MNKQKWRDRAMIFLFLMGCLMILLKVFVWFCKYANDYTGQ
jgi:predicted nucleic acid-binding Zn ribbon protein